ncbi:MAG: flavodoxin domain-containing protein, partial [Muribaculaceae bacterium]|nr:flavodoxin domain-containing protein [Muribaculaceae bacterium]
MIMKTGIFYGSTTGTTAELAKTIAKEIGVADADIHDVASTAPARLGDYDFIILGSSTWGDGDLQDDWFDFVDGAQALDLDGKKIAIFGCG